MGWKVLLERLRAPGATTGQVPTYDATTKRFTMATPGGGGTFSVKTVTANQSATNDTLANLTDLACAIGSSETFVYRYCLKVDIGDGIQVAATAPAGATIEMAAVGLCDAGGSEYPALQASDGSAITFTGANGFTLHPRDESGSTSLSSTGQRRERSTSSGRMRLLALARTQA